MWFAFRFVDEGLQSGGGWFIRAMGVWMFGIFLVLCGLAMCNWRALRFLYVDLEQKFVKAVNR